MQRLLRVSQLVCCLLALTTEATAQLEPETYTWRPIITADSGFVISVPTSWKVSSELMESGFLTVYAPADFQGDPYRENLTVQLQEMTDTQLLGLDESIAQVRRQDPGLNNVPRDWVASIILNQQLTISQIQKLPDVRMLVQDRAFRNGRLLLHTQVQFTEQGRPLLADYYTVLHNGGFYVFSTTALKLHAGNYQAVFKYLMDSLQLH